jgi:hypothetical protein
LRFDHVADREVREFGAMLALAVARRSGQSISDRIGCNNEILVGVERFSRTDQKINAMMIAGN